MHCRCGKSFHCQGLFTRFIHPLKFRWTRPHVWAEASADTSCEVLGILPCGTLRTSASPTCRGGEMTIASPRPAKEEQNKLRPLPSNSSDTLQSISHNIAFSAALGYLMRTLVYPDKSGRYVHFAFFRVFRAFREPPARRTILFISTQILTSSQSPSPDSVIFTK
jgi:hypothetical protein